MPHGHNLANLRDVLDAIGDLVADGASITYTDADGTWTLRDVTVSATGFGGFVEG